MTWDAYKLHDHVQFTPPGGDRVMHAEGVFAVFAKHRKHAEITARVHLCFLLHAAGLLQFERSESTDDLAE